MSSARTPPLTVPSNYRAQAASGSAWITQWRSRVLGVSRWYSVVLRVRTTQQERVERVHAVRELHRVGLLQHARRQSPARDTCAGDDRAESGRGPVARGGSVPPVVVMCAATERMGSVESFCRARSRFTAKSAPRSKGIESKPHILQITAPAAPSSAFTNRRERPSARRQWLPLARASSWNRSMRLRTHGTSPQIST